MPRSEDQFYSSAIKLTDEAILSLKKAVEENQLKDGQFCFLSYLLSRPALSLKELVKLSKVKSLSTYSKDVTVICLSLFTDGLSTTTPTILFNLYCLAAWPGVQQRVYDEIVEQVIIMVMMMRIIPMMVRVMKKIMLMMVINMLKAMINDHEGVDGHNDDRS